MRSARRLVATASTAAIAVAGWAVVSPAGPAGAAATPTTLGTTAVGPLKLGMSRSAAVKTGWLSNRGTGCPLGGKPYPITYALKGSKAPSGLRGTVEFVGGKLNVMTFTKGVRTTTGVTVGTTTSAMVAKSKAAGFKAKLEPSETFGGTFVHVTKGGDDVLAGFAEGSGKRVGQLGIPTIPVCD
ncbi:hypothetical protein [Patulibacter minatonensis]|uniref:hypothetical protein n=1 Tax=Patulibacter minatonensis TaxID=298163 RepID=UPI00047BEA20|nr:hypothetical protein [Patulibacter minatonensis]